MYNFIVKTIKYLVLIILLSSSIICIFIIKKPELFLGSPIDFFYCKYQYNQIDKKNNFNNIIIGDSRGNASINPKKLGKNWINLSLPGSDFFDGYITLKHYLSKNKLDTLIMIYGTDYISENSQYFNFRTIPFKFLTYDELDTLELVERKYKYIFHGDSSKINLLFRLDQFSRKLKYLHFPLSYRETFLNGLNSLVYSQSDIYSKKIKIETLLKNNLGYINFGEADSSNINSIYGKNYFTTKPISLHYLDLIMNLTSKKNISTFLIIPPINHASFIAYDKSNYQNSFNKFLNNLKKKYAKLSILQQPVSLPNTMFGDQTHLNKNGTALYTKLLREKLKIIGDSCSRLF